MNEWKLETSQKYFVQQLYLKINVLITCLHCKNNNRNSRQKIFHFKAS